MALRRACLVAAIAVAVAVAAASPAGAQTAAPDTKLEKIEVTGTNIRRTDTETGLPVQVITRQEIDRGGLVTAQDILERISANQSYGGWNDSLGVNNSLGGFTGASLRGLGAERTLVLLNGRRLAPYALSGGQSVDLSGIPVSAIERVEVLKDGASAVYGTDAIGGVVNFILRKDFRGLEASGMFLGVEQGGGESARATITGGWGDLAKDRWNALLSVDHVRQEPLRANEREFSKTSYLPEVGLNGTSASSVPGNVRQRGGFGNQLRNPTIPASGPVASSCAPPFSFPQVAAPLACFFDYAPLADNIAESRKTNVVGRLSWQAHADHLAFAEGSHYRGEFTYKSSPTPVVVSDPFNNPLQVRPTSPFYPAAWVASVPRGNPNLPLQLNYRLVELGPRTREPEVEQSRFVAGLQGVVKGWDYQLATGHTVNRQVDYWTGGFVSESGFRQLFDANRVNPFAPNTPAVIEQMRATQVTGAVSDNRASHTGAELKVSSTPWELPAGGLAVALGLEGRREELKQVNADVLYSGDVLGAGGPSPSLEPVTRRVWSLFAEANVPVARTLEANLAVRHDQYSDFGGTTNPKLTLRWQPEKNLVLRGSVGTGFRAPTLSDLFVPNAFPVTSVESDPVRCPVTGAASDCEEVVFRTKTGGNPELKPEKSRQLNVGVVFEPTPGLSLALDYYRVRIEDIITIVPLEAIFADPARWSSTHVFRRPPDPAEGGLPGPIDYVVATQWNAGTRETSGYDVDIRFRFPAASWGRLTASLSGTYVDEYQASEFEAVGAGTADLVGGRGAIARWRHYAALDWSLGAWGATLAQNFQLGHREYDPLTRNPATGAFSGFRRVGSHSILDFQARYSGLKGLTAALGIRNLLDRDPPSAYGTTTFQRGYDPSYADPRGRMFYLSLAYAWR